MGQGQSNDEASTRFSSGIQPSPKELFPLLELPYVILKEIADFMDPTDLVAHAMVIPRLRYFVGTLSSCKVTYFKWRISGAYPKFSYIEIKFEKDPRLLQILPPTFGNFTYEFKPKPNQKTSRFAIIQKQNKYEPVTTVLQPNYKVNSENCSLKHLGAYTSILLRFLRVWNFQLKIRHVTNDQFDFLNMFVWKNTRGCQLDIDSTDPIPVEHIYNMDCWRLKVFLAPKLDLNSMYEIIEKWRNGGFANMEYLELDTGHHKLENRGKMVTMDFERRLKRMLCVIHGCTFKLFVTHIVQ